MVRRVANHAACFRIQVPSKALSGASVETRISRVRRSSFAADVSLAKERSRGDEETYGTVLYGDGNMYFACRNCGDEWIHMDIFRF